MWYFGGKAGKGSISGFSSSSTAEQVTQGIDGTPLTAIVTGASSGIGVETTRVLALRGVHVVMAVRNVEAGNKVKEKIILQEKIATEKINVMELDLSSFASVRKFALEFISLGIPLNILINNAGTLLIQELKLSEDNIELNFATNHIGHFLLTNLLLETMKTTASQSQVEGRVINVSSSGHTYAPGLHLDKINTRTGMNYQVSKLANILHANELARRLKDEGVAITANSLHPGVVYTRLFRHESLYDWVLKALSYALFKSVQQGAATTCYMALNPQVKGLSGEYFEDCNVSKASALAGDTKLAKELWDFSISLID